MSLDVVVLASSKNFEVPPLEELFDFPPFGFSKGWELFGVPLTVNRHTMLIVMGTFAVCLFLVAAFRQRAVVPGRLQSIGESLVEFIREQIVIPVIGPEGLRFMPFLVTLFLFVFVNNFFEIMPLVQFPTSSRMAIPAFLALTVWVMFIAVGVKSQGPKYFFNSIFPPGVPKAMYVLVTPIELVSVFVVRPLTLAVRLFANMMAGHIILAVVFIAANAFFFNVVGGVSEWSLNVKGLPLGILMLAAGPALVGFELMVGALQAYVFTILAAVYIGSSLHAEH